MAIRKKEGKIEGKVKFGKKRVGMKKKHYGPKEEKPKKYRGQGR